MNAAQENKMPKTTAYGDTHNKIKDSKLNISTNYYTKMSDVL